MSDRVLVTGGSGFIGSHLVRKLLAMGFDVGITVRVDHVEDNWRLKDVWHDLATVIEMDIRNRDSMNQIVVWNPSAVFHLAAYHHVGRSWEQVEECFDVNAKGSANVIDAAMTCGAQLVYMSTSEVYGSCFASPWSEDLQVYPASPYGVTKYAGEQYAAMTERKNGFKKVNIARPFNVFGPGQSDRAVIGEFIQKALRGETIYMTKGTQTREFNYVHNVVEGLIMLWQRNPGIGPWNIASGQDISIYDLVMRIHELSNSTSKIMPTLPDRPNEIWKMCADPTRFRMATGWEPRVDFDEGLQQTINWYQSHLEKK